MFFCEYRFSLDLKNTRVAIYLYRKSAKLFTSYIYCICKHYGHHIMAYIIDTDTTYFCPPLIIANLT